MGQASANLQATPAAATTPAGGNGHEPAGLAGSAAAPTAGATAEAAASPGFAARITVEGILWIAMVAVAALTRFWDLGSRALHHDESLHAYYSWLLATGQGYVHDPLMHGPFLFHANALVYLLFGATDAATRFMPALCGTALVALPYLLRGPRQLGRWGALAAAFLLLISPALLYQGRYIRHDTFTVAAALALFIAIVRYVELPERRWLIVAAISLGVLITNHEIVFGIVAFFLLALAAPLLWKELRPALPVLAVAGALALLLVAKLPDWTGRPLPSIPWESPTQEEQVGFYRELLTNPLTIAIALLAVVTVAGVALALRRRRDPARAGEGWVRSLLGDAQPGTVAHAVDAAWADRTGLGIALGIVVAFFVLFFTTFLTNLYGLASGTVATDGTLLYWLGQHDYRRGEQPWFYYLLLFPQYEPIAAVLGTAAAAVIGWRTLLVALGKRAPGPQGFCAGLLATWYVLILASLSWAGEKMPWLVIHITLPATLLAGLAIGRMVDRWSAAGAASPRRAWGGPEWATVAALAALAGGWFLLAGRMTYPAFAPGPDPGGWSRSVQPEMAERWWLLGVFPLLAAVALLVAAVLRGPARAGMAAGAAALGLLSLLQVHFGWRLAYLEGDVPKDMLVYTQTAPDVHRMTGELTALSEELTGGNGLEIWYDNGVSWPMQWYLRDFDNRRLYSGPGSVPPDAPVVLVGSENLYAMTDGLDGYTPQEYVLRWWFPEDRYRDFALAPELPPGRSAWKSPDQPHGPLDVLRSVGSSLATLATPQGQQELYRLVMYRDLPSRIDSYRYTMFVRNDLVPVLNAIRY